MKVGYVRVSTHDQNTNHQMDALKNAGCEKIFTDIASGAKSSRPGLDELMKFVREGDTIIVWKLDRFGRSLKHLIDSMNELEKRGIGFESLQESIDTTTPVGKLFFHIIAALAEFEREIIRERTNSGLSAARARGRKGGRPRKLSESRIEMALQLLEKYKVSEVTQILDISKSTLCRAIKENRQSVQK